VPTQPAAGPTPGANTGNSGIIVSVWDSVRHVSLVQYLGLRLDDFLTGNTNATPETGLTLDFGKLGAASGANSFASVFGTSDQNNIQYMVSAFDNTDTSNGATNLLGKRLLTTLDSTPAAVRNGTVGNITAIANTFMSTLGAAGACAGGNPCVALDDQQTDYAENNFGADYSGFMTVASAAAGIGNPLGFYSIAAGSNTGTQNASVTQYGNSLNFAQWLLSADGGLKYTLDAAAVVPLPAAIWLLLSGLAGVGVVGRRRTA